MARTTLDHCPSEHGVGEGVKRRTFLLTAGALTSAGFIDWARPEVAHADPGSEGGGPVVSTRTDLALLAPTTPGIDLDGTLSDPNWAEPALQETSTLFYLEPVDTALHLVHDEEHLYVGVRVSGGIADTMTHASVVVRGGPGSDYRAATVRVRQDSPEVNFNWGGGVEQVEDVQEAFVVADGEVTCELAIPLAELGISDPVGAELGINVVIDHEEMTDPTTAAAPTRTSSNSFDGRADSSLTYDTDIVDEDRVATLLLGEVRGSGSEEPADLVQADEFTLEYTGFDTKRLTFGLERAELADDFTLQWREPGDQWSTLELGAVELVDRGRVRTFETQFEHPAPTLFGQYQLRLGVRSSGRGEERVIIATFDRENLMDAGYELPANETEPPQGDETVAAEPPDEEIEALLALIPDRTGFRFCGAPDEPDLRPQDLFDWSPDEPQQMVARSTGTVYPNDDYPEDQELTVTNLLGETVSYPFHEDAEGNRYFLSGHLWYLQREHVYANLQDVAQRDPLGAARLLYRFAQVYQGWVSTNEYPEFNRPVEPGSTPRNYWWGGTWARWSTSELGAMINIGKAMVMVAETDAFEVLSEEVGEDVYDLLVEDTIKPSVDWWQTFSRIYHNMDYPSYQGTVALAWAFGDPRWIHETAEWTQEYLHRGYLYDGFFRETTLSYHFQSLQGLLRIAADIEGWSDPEGYISPRTGETLTDLDLMERMPVLSASERLTNVLTYPNGKLFPMADTWAASTANAPEPDAGSVIYGGGGIVRLSRGQVSADSLFGIVLPLDSLSVDSESDPPEVMPDDGAVQVQADQDGASITFDFELLRSGDFDVDLRALHAPDYGQYEISIDDTALATHDFYASAGGAARPETLGRIDLAAGQHTLTFTGSGRNSASQGWQMGLAAVALLDEAARELRDGALPQQEANPTQLYQLFTPKYGHNHYDPLDIALWAEGQELLPDIGYTHTFYRRWTQSTLGHNTVTVDSADLETDTGSDGGALEVFDSGGEGCQVMRAEFGDAYPQTSVYQRETWSIEHPGTDRHEGYVLDLFRVSGGERHEYCLMGDANHDAAMSTSVDLAEYGPYLLPEGVEVTEPENENDYGDAEGHYYGYIYVREVQRGELDDGRYDVTLTTEVDEEPGSMLNILGLTGGDAEFFLGESPSLRSTRLDGRDGDLNSEATKYWAPKFVVRREGEDLHSEFVTVIEPHAAGTEARIESVEELEHDGPEGTLAVQVTHADGTVDVVLSTQSDEETVTAGEVSLTGKMGFVRLQDGSATLLRLVGGTSLTAPGAELSGTGAVSGTVSGTLRIEDGEEVNAVLTSEEVPDWVEGHTLVVYRPDGKTLPYPIEALSSADGQSVLELGDVDPGFSLDEDGGGELTYFPHTQWDGEVTFRVENAESA